MSKRTAGFSPGSEAPSIKQKKNKSKSNNTTTNFNTPASTSTPRERPYRFEKPIVYGTGELHTSINKIPEFPAEITRHTSIVSPPLDVIILEVFKKDGAQFDDPLPREALKLIWSQHLDRRLDEVRILFCEQFRGKCLKIFYRLKVETPIIEITKAHETEFEIKLGSKTHVFNARFPQFKDITCELGKLISLTIYKIPHDVDCEDLREWLGLFGELKSNFRYTHFN